MSQAQSMRRILDLVSILNQGMQGQATPDTLLEQALPAVAACVPGGNLARVYRLTGDRLLLWASGDGAPVDRAESPITIDSHPAYVRALGDLAPTWDADEGLLVLPLQGGDNLLGLIEIGVEGTQDVNVDSLRPIAHHLVLALENLIMRDLLQRQTVASLELRDCTTLHEIVGAFARHMLKNGQFASINIFRYDENSVVTGFDTIVSANRREAFEMVDAIDLTIEEMGLSTEREYSSVLVLDVENETTVNPKLRDWLNKHGVKSFYTLPMRVEGRTFGFISINSTHGIIDLIGPEMQALQSLTDQVGALVQVHNLTEETGYIHNISERQAMAFNRLTVGQSFAEMARIIAGYMLPQPGQYLTINQLEFNDGGQITGWRVMASANRNQSFDAETSFTMDWQLLPDVLRQAVEDGEPYIVSDAVTDLNTALSPQLRQLFEADGIKSLLSVPIMTGGRTETLLTVLNRTQISFTQDKINAFTNLADQMGALINVQNTLGEVESARELVENLVLASRLITTAADVSYMAQAISYTVAQGMSAVSITLFDRLLDMGETPVSRRVVALNSAETALETEPSTPMADIPGTEQFDALWRGMPIVINNVRDDDNLMRGWLREIDVNWIASFGMRIGGKLFGTLDVMDKSIHTLSPEQTAAYTTLADLIGISIRSRQLLESSRTAEELASRMVQINHQISLAGSDVDMAQAVIHAMPDFVDEVAFLLFDKPISPSEIPLTTTITVLASRDEVIQCDVVDTPSGESEELLKLFDRLREGEVIIIPDTRTYAAVIAPNALAMLAERGIYSVAGMGLRTGTRLFGYLLFGAEEPLPIDVHPHGNFRAITDQIAITMENRNLLNQTSDALGFVYSQYETSNRILNSNNPEEMLKAILDFAEGHYERAYLGLIDNSTVPSTINIIASTDATTAPPPSVLDKYVSFDDLLSLRSVIVQDVAQNDLLEEDVKAHLLDTGIRSLLTVPMAAHQMLIGLLIFNNSEPSQLPFNRLRALRGIADQMAVVFENQDLLHQTEESLEETSTLYEVNRSLLQSQDTLTVLHVLHTFVAPDAMNVNYMDIGYGKEGNIVSLYIRHSSTPEGEQGVDLPAHELFNEEDLSALQRYWEKQGSRVEILEDFEKTPSDIPLSKLIEGQGIRSTVVIPFHHQGQRVGQVNISYAEAREFDEKARRLFSAVSRQVVFVLQSHRLLRDTQQSATQLNEQVLALQTLNDLATTLNRVQDEKTLLDEASRSLVTALGVDHVGIAMFSPDGMNLTIVSEYPLQGALGTIVTVEGDDVQTRLREERKPLVLSLDDELSQSVSNREVLEQLGIVSLALFPLLDLKGKYLGSVGLDLYTADRKFNTAMMDIAQTIVLQMAVGLQNIRLLRDTQQSAAQLAEQVNILQALSELAAMLNVVQDEPTLLNRTCETLVTALNIDHAGITLLDPDGKMATVVGEYPAGGAVGLKIEATGEVWSRLREQNAPVTINDVDNNPNLEEKSRAALQTVGIKSALFLPLLDPEGNILGSVGLDILTEEAKFQPEMVEIAQTIFAQATVTLQNIRLLRVSQRRAEQMQQIATFSQWAQATQDLSSIFQMAINTCAKMMALDHMSIIFHDTERKELRVVAIHDTDKTHVDMVSGPIVTMDTVLGQGWGSQDTLHITDARKEPDKRHPLNSALRSMIITPIFSRRETTGLVNIGSRNPYSYDPTDILVFRQMVNQLTVAIDNAEAYTQSQRVAKNKALTSEITAHLQQQLDINGVLNVTMNELGRAIGAHRARIRLGAQYAADKEGNEVE